MTTYKDINTSVFLLLSLTTARAFSFQSSTFNSDILKQLINASNCIVENDQLIFNGIPGQVADNGKTYNDIYYGSK